MAQLRPSVDVRGLGIPLYNGMIRQGGDRQHFSGLAAPIPNHLVSPMGGLADSIERHLGIPVQATNGTAQSVVDVILGEAGGETRADRLADMRNVASVILNRSRGTNTTPEQVVAGDGQFDAYGINLPGGVENLRQDAERIWQEIQTNGPVHNGTFMVTPAARDGLERDVPGLEQVTEVAGGHVILADPQFRPLVTAAGVRPVEASALGAAPPPASHAARAEAPPLAGGRTIVPGAGLANLVPAPGPAARDGGFNTGRILYAHPERGSWDAGLTDRAKTAAQMMAAASPTGIDITSAYRDPEINRRAGGARKSQHLAGNALDLNLAGLSDAERAKRVFDARVAGATRIGSYTRSPDMMHVDFATGWPATDGGVYSKHDESHSNFATGAPGWFKEGLAIPFPTPTPKPSQDAGAGRGFSAGGPSIVPNAPVDAIQAGPGRGGSISVSPGGLANVVPLALPDTAPRPGNRISGLMPERPRSISALPLPKSAPLPTARPGPTLPARPISRTPAAAMPFKPNAVKAFPLAPAVPAKPLTTRSIREPIIRKESFGQSGAKYSGLQGMQAVYSGKAPVGAVAFSASNPGFSVMGLPTGNVARTSGKYGWTEVYSPADDDVLGIHYGKVIAVDPTGTKHKAVTPAEAKSLAAKGWAVSSMPGKGFSKAPAPGTAMPAALAGLFGNKSGQKSSGPSLGGFLSGLFGGKGVQGKSLGQQAVGQALGLAAGLVGPAGGMGGLGLSGGFSGPSGLGGGGYGNPGFGGGISGNANYGGR